MREYKELLISVFLASAFLVLVLFNHTELSMGYNRIFILDNKINRKIRFLKTGCKEYRKTFVESKYFQTALQEKNS